jgi:glycine/D-amino acid oxidase-like deaminating enzyme
MTAGATVVVIGGGVEGLSTARALVERGVADVTVVERETIGSGGTAKSSSIVRCHYGVPSLAAMAWRSVPVITHAREILGDDAGFRPSGYLVGVGENNVEPLRANVAMQQALGIDVELIGADRAAELWPVANMEDFAAFAYEPQGGYADAYLSAQAFAGAARRGGARIRQQTPVAAIEATPGERVTGVRLADGARVGADVVVVAAGPWSTALVAPLGVDLPIRAQRAQILLIDPGAPLGVVPVLSDLVSLQYVRGEGDVEGGRGRLLHGDSDHRQPEWADPDTYADRADDDYLTDAIPKLEHRFPKLAAPALSASYAGCYDTTPDYNPVIGPASVEGLYLCAGFSGHGFKISPAVGELMADVICDGASRHREIDHRDFRLERFAEGRPLLAPHPYAGAGEMR